MRDSQQLQRKPRPWAIHNLLPLLQSGPALLGHWNRGKVGRAGGSMGSGTYNACWELGHVGSIGLRRAPNRGVTSARNSQHWGPPD